MNNEAQDPIFSGNIYIFAAFDVGDDINLEAVRQTQDVQTRSINLTKFFKNYHVPISIDLPHPHDSTHYFDAKLHQFGAISITYKIPIKDTLKNLRQTLITIDENHQQQSINDAYSIYKKIKPFISSPNFFHLKKYYTAIQIETQKEFNGEKLQKEHGYDIATLLRFETQILSEYQKDEILESSVGYFKKDLIVIDTEAAFIYDPQHEELLDFFELGNIQQLELQFFDKQLDKQLTTIYENKTKKLPLLAYMPFIGSRYFDPIGELTQLKVDISVITERLEGSIKLVGEPYFSDIYRLIHEKLDIINWQESIAKKFDIVKELRYGYQSKIDAIREDLLSTLIIILIMIELLVAIMQH